MHDLPEPSQTTELPDETPGDTTLAKLPARQTRLYVLLAIAGLMLIAVIVIRPTAAICGSGPAVGEIAPQLDLFPICQNQAVDQSSVTRVSSETNRVGAVHSNVSVGQKFPMQVINFEQCQVSVVHFWGTWCGPCRDELPELAEMVCELDGNPEFQFLSISCAAFDDPSLATLEARTCQFYQANGVRLPTFADPVHAARAKFLQIMQRSSMAYPTTILIDRDGIIRATWVGVPPGGADTIRRRVMKLLDE